MNKLAESYQNPLAIRSKQMLTEAFFELLEEKPGSSIKISKLCEKAGVARPTFYSHYNTIEDIPKAYFDQWLDDVKSWVDQQANHTPDVILNPDNQFSSNFGKLLFVYWCNEVELVKKLQNAGYENVILQTFIKAHEYVMKGLVAPVQDLSIYFQDFLQTKAGIVAYELYKFWIATDLQLTVNQLAKIHSALTTNREIVDIQKITMGIDKTS